ncbi:MFS transporter [Alicyclobacillaceae bacterium I2511]|nr:MFS transporter [Alicyclobacillaceae bacterium I2511]
MAGMKMAVLRRLQRMLANPSLWVIALVSFSYLLAFMQRTAPGVVGNQLQAQFHITAAVLGTVASIQFFLYMVLQIPVGLFGDRLGPEKLFVAGVVIDGVGAIVFGSAHSLTELLTGRALVGLGDALIWVNIVLILSRWFSTEMFGSMLGIVSTAGNVGGLLATVPLATWVSVSDWATPFLDLGAITIAVAVLNTLVFLGVPFLGLRARRPPAHRSSVRVQRVPVWTMLRLVVRDRLSWATFACHFGAVGTYTGFISLWAVPFFMTIYGVSRAGATVFTLVGAVSSLVSAPIVGALSDRFGQRKLIYFTLQTASTLAWLSVLVWVGQPSHWAGLLVMAVTGFGAGGALLTFAVIRDGVPTQRAGVTSGFANTGGFLSAVLLPVLFGVLLQAGGGGSPVGTDVGHAYTLAFAVPAFFSFVGVVGTLLIPKRRGRPV